MDFALNGFDGLLVTPTTKHMFKIFALPLAHFAPT